MPEGVEEGILRLFGEGVGEDDDEGAAVELFGEEVEGGGKVSLWG